MTQIPTDTLDRVRTWMFDVALPLWLERGIEDDGLFHERFDFLGNPDKASPRRIRVQARQLYVLNQAVLLGRDVVPDILDRALDSFTRRGWSPDGRPGWIHLVSPQGIALDTKRDSYDHAFALFALAYVYRNKPDDAVRALADQTLAFMDDGMSNPAGGYLEGVPHEPPHRSNPHMHFLEAMLAWYETTGDAVFLTRANGVIDLFLTHFFDPATGTLGEYFDAGWKKVAGPDGLVVEPGHHCEWSWLLMRAADMGARDARAEAVRLYDFALAHGLEDETGFAIDECDVQGAQIKRSRRVWPQTELIKAHVAHGNLGEAAFVADLVLDSYLATEIPGLWLDQYDEHGRGMTKMVPASSLYHLVVAFRELLDAGQAEAAAAA